MMPDSEQHDAGVKRENNMPVEVASINPMQSHVKSAGVILIVVNLFTVVASVLFWAVWNIFVDIIRQIFNLKGSLRVHFSELSFHLHVFLNIVFISFFVLGIIGIIVGICFLRKQNWARFMTIILAFLHIVTSVFYGFFTFPAGLIYVMVSIILSGYLIFVASHKETKNLFTA